MIALIDAPTNLGLRPPEPSSVPGCAKAPEALREAGFHARMETKGARLHGVVLPGRYVDDWRYGEARVRNQEALVDHALRLADRIAATLAADAAPLVIGGDCSLLVGAGLALARRGRFGLIHIDGHTDFRHPGNSDRCASVAGEDLAAAVGLHWPAISNIDGLGPYFSPEATIHIGCRDDDEGLDEARSMLPLVVTARQWIADPAAVLNDVRQTMETGIDGYWLHVDVDILEPDHMPAVDSPSPGGLDPNQLTELLTGLAPGAVGAQVTVFDPDLDPKGIYATLVAGIVSAGLARLGESAPRSAWTGAW